MIKQLMLAKYIFKKGEECIDIDSPMSSGLAISLFQDSIETVIWSIAKEVDAKVGDKDAISNIINAIPKGTKNSGNIPLPLTAKVLEINKARVNFKHYGILPATSEAIKYQEYTRQFIIEATRAFFNLDFDDISLADLITDDKIRTRLKEAETLLKEGSIDKSIKLCAEADYFVMRKLDVVFPGVDPHLTEAAHIFERDKLHQAHDFIRYIKEYLDVLRNASLVGLLGIKLTEYVKYKRIAPKTIMFESGKFGRCILQGPLSTQDIKYCIDYVTKVAIGTQEKLNI